MLVEMSTQSTEKKYLLFVGNPGVGKSTLQNCTQRSTNPWLKDKYLFKSGVSFGSGMTFQLDTREVGEVIYMDTPGLEDTKMRKQAAEAITKALKSDGTFQVVFVVTLESGRVRPVDVSTISLVLDSVPGIKSYGLIFNKISNVILRRLQQDKSLAQKLISQVSQHENRRSIYPLFLPNIPELQDKDNAVVDLPELNNFLKTLPSFQIKAENVKEIKTNVIEKYREDYEKQLAPFRQKQKAMRQEMEEEQRRRERHVEQQLREHEQKQKREYEQRRKEMKERQEQQLLHENMIKSIKDLIDALEKIEREEQIRKLREQNNELRNRIDSDPPCCII